MNVRKLTGEVSQKIFLVVYRKVRIVPMKFGILNNDSIKSQAHSNYLSTYVKLDYSERGKQQTAIQTTIIGLVDISSLNRAKFICCCESRGIVPKKL